MARVLALALAALALPRAGAVGSGVETEVDAGVDGTMDMSAYMDVVAGAASSVSSAEDMEEYQTNKVDRPKGARRRAHERGLQAELLSEVASSGCAQLGGKWFADPHGNLFQVEQKGCMIDFMLTVAKSPKKHRKRGVIRGTDVMIEPPFPAGKVLANQSIRFDNGKDWVRKW
ncbi:unnamed protein product [Prorocentrum cordatum]|uniref:Uncharacterized protein n=1 Tax=Prorocentrum cordatum TaxID=2364126 RepID=A0ABN9Q5A7_9DINO|nr:unnamed protein product [Polarella glacialis]